MVYYVRGRQVLQKHGKKATYQNKTYSMYLDNCPIIIVLIFFYLYCYSQIWLVHMSKRSLRVRENRLPHNCTFPSYAPQLSYASTSKTVSTCSYG